MTAKHRAIGNAMAAPGRALIVGLGCVGLVVAAAGIWFWWFLDLVTATDPEPYFMRRR